LAIIKLPWTRKTGQTNQLHDHSPFFFGEGMAFCLRFFSWDPSKKPTHQNLSEANIGNFPNVRTHPLLQLVSFSQLSREVWKLALKKKTCQEMKR